jgi:hypothetical protein
MWLAVPPMTEQSKETLAELKLKHMLSGVKLHILSKSASETIVIEELNAFAVASVRYIAALEVALKPFALTDEEAYELQSFLDEELIFMRPDDGNDSVLNGWRKNVTIGDVRKATEGANGVKP